MLSWVVDKGKFCCVWEVGLIEDVCGEVFVVGILMIWYLKFKLWKVSDECRI